MAICFQQIISTITKNFSDMDFPNVRSVFGTGLLHKIREEGDRSLLHWLVRALYGGPLELESLDEALGNIESRYPAATEVLKEKLSRVYTHTDCNFRSQLTALLAEIWAFEFFLDRSGLSFTDIEFINETNSSCTGRIPDYKITRGTNDVVYVEVKQMQGIHDIVTLFHDSLLRKSVTDPDNFSFEFAVEPKLECFVLDGKQAGEFVSYCIQELEERSNPIEQLEIMSPNIPKVSARITIKEGPSGVSVLMPERLDGNGVLDARREFLIFGQFYSRLVSKMHEAFVQLSEFRYENGLKEATEDWIYIKADDLALERFVFDNRYIGRMRAIVGVLDIQQYVNLVVNDKHL